jgi:ribonucleoside-diphosphate reductase alpha chain
MALIESRSGERGIFNRGSLAATLPARRIKALKSYKGYFDSSGQHIVGLIGTNPCGEIILQSKQFCNLSEVVARAEDTEKSLMKKIRVAAILGTYQSMLTHFEYLSKEWKERCEKERLLGVSVTGQWDCPAVRKPEAMKRLRDEAIKVNAEYAKRFGISASTAVTCVKPSGNGSQTFDCSSGMHPRHSRYYIRRARIASTDSLFKMLRDQGVPFFPEVGQTMENATTYVLEFPVMAPKGTETFKNDLSAIEQLEYWKMVKVSFTEHNPSVTISVGNDEWITVANWVYENWDIVGGLSFLPREDHVYQLAPYEAIDEKKYKELAKRLENVDYSKILTYEKQNETDMKKELACVSGVCEIV